MWCLAIVHLRQPQKKTDECGSTILVESRGMHWKSWDKVFMASDREAKHFIFSSFQRSVLQERLTPGADSFILIKRMGTGSSISVWNDLWLPTTRPRKTNTISTQTSQWILSLIPLCELWTRRQFGIWWTHRMWKL